MQRGNHTPLIVLDARQDPPLVTSRVRGSVGVGRLIGWAYLAQGWQGTRRFFAASVWERRVEPATAPSVRPSVLAVDALGQPGYFLHRLPAGNYNRHQERLMGMLHPPKTPIPDVFITEQLEKRAPKKTDYLQEKLALQDLAVRMADQPEDVLPRFVDLAMEMAGGVSAGLSLYEENPAPGVFRWTYLRGVLSPFNGATTPRDFSPCYHAGPQCAGSVAASRARLWLDF